jgi:hypothetical protein
MQRLEAVLCALLLARYALGLSFGVDVLSVAAFAAHVRLECRTWQLYPLYAALAMHFATSSYLLSQPSTLAWLMSITQVTLVLSSALASLVLPIPSLPPVRGPYAVGATFFTWMQTTKVQRYQWDSASEQRTTPFAVRLWYPIDPALNKDNSGFVAPTYLLPHACEFLLAS